MKRANHANEMDTKLRYKRITRTFPTPVKGSQQIKAINCFYGTYEMTAYLHELQFKKIYTKLNENENESARSTPKTMGKIFLPLL